MLNRKTPIKVVVVDDHPLMREGVVSQMRRGNGIKVVGEAGQGNELFVLLEKLEGDVDVVLLDLQMPEMNGPQSLIELKSKFPKIKVVVLSMFNERRMVREMFRLGANAYMTKDLGSEALIDAIYNVHYKGVHAQDADVRALQTDVLEEINSGDIEPLNFDQLKERDLTVLNMICEGMTSEEIAPHLGISKQTIDLCRARLISHFKARNVVHLVAEAIRLGIYIPRN